MIYLVGPSHIHDDYIWQVKAERARGELFAGMTLDAHRGMPVWARYIRNAIAENVARQHDVAWMVIDFKSNNKNYDQLCEMQGGEELYLDEMGHPGNIERHLMGPQHIEVLGRHSLRVLDKAVADFPRLKLIFWCLFMRSKCHESSYPRHLQYDAIRERYAGNIIDIEEFVTVEAFRGMVKDLGGHPNAAGFALIDKMLRTAFAKTEPAKTAPAKDERRAGPWMGYHTRETGWVAL